MHDLTTQEMGNEPHDGFERAFQGLALLEDGQIGEKTWRLRT